MIEKTLSDDNTKLRQVKEVWKDIYEVFGGLIKNRQMNKRTNKQKQLINWITSNDLAGGGRVVHDGGYRTYA